MKKNPLLAHRVLRPRPRILANGPTWLPKCGQVLVICPDGTIVLGPGFQRQEDVHGTSRPEGAEDICDQRSIWSVPVRLTRQFYRPFGAGHCINRCLGLKPQAESYSPFGTKTVNACPHFRSHISVVDYRSVGILGYLSGARRLLGVGIAFTTTLSLLVPPIQAREKTDPTQTVQQLVQDRSGKEVRWETDQAAREQALQDVRALLRQPLTINATVQIALLNNRSLQATFEELGLSLADVREAATIPNPRFDLAIRVPDKPPSGTYIDYNTAIDFLSIIMIPLKKRVAQDRLESATLRVADDTLELVSKVKIAFYSIQASQVLLQQLKVIVDTNGASLDLAQRQFEAGNISNLTLARRQDDYNRAKLDVATAEAEIRQNREKLTRLLGLWGRDTDWQISGSLPPVPASDPPTRGLEQLAISQRLDLQADYLQVTSQAKDLGLTKSFRLLGALDFGVESERETDAQTRTGPTFAIELPLFNQGQARIARGDALLRQQEAKFEALAIEVRSEIRELRDELITKRQVAGFYQDELLPNQRKILADSLKNYNAAEMSDFELFNTKAEEARAEREYIETVRDYWITRAELERAVGGSLNPRVRSARPALSKH